MAQQREPGLDASTQGAAAVAAAIARWTPRSVSQDAAAFARDVVARAGPATSARARALLFAAARLADFGAAVGLEPRAELLLHPSVIERFVVAGCPAVAPATRRTLRTNLRALARALEQHPQPAPVALPRERAKAPYSDAEIAGYLRLAGAQPTEARRLRAAALICLGAGAGIVAGELRQLRGTDVLRRSGGLVVVVAGRRARVVPVLCRFQAPLEAAARFAGQGYLTGGRDSGRRNLSDVLAA